MRAAHPGEKVVLLTSTLQAKRTPVRTPGQDEAGKPTLGSLLADRHGQDFVAVGLTFGKGRVRVWRREQVVREVAGARMKVLGDWDREKVGTAKPVSLEAGLLRTRTRFLLDPRAGSGLPALRPWLEGWHPFRSFGGGGQESWNWTVPALDFDLLVFVREVAPDDFS
ncbi:MAG: erythromycin esterase family protein [Planctomycetes bacterium]|nr:erythromycin esterase family protein [Planctomycetota bacterium]MBL7008860.1 erythromycin esterase family protein [Planctomycetota bacterium]